MMAGSSSAPECFPITLSSSTSESLQTNRPGSSSIMSPQRHEFNSNLLPCAAVPPFAPAGGLGTNNLDSPSTPDRLSMALSQPSNMAPACHACTMMCARGEHGGGGISHGRAKSRPPCFFKVVSDYSVEGGPSCWMQVPAEFVRNYMLHVNQKGMVLENAEGKTWPVVYMFEHGFFTGWGEFSTANKLATGDTLIFFFVEDAKFVVHIFSKWGCEKRPMSITDTTTSTQPQITNSDTERNYGIPNPMSDPIIRLTRSVDVGLAADPSGPAYNYLSRSPSFHRFMTPPSRSHNGVFYEPPDDDGFTSLPQLPDDDDHNDLRTPQPIIQNSTPSQFRCQSAPAPRINVNAPPPSWHDEAGPSSCPIIAPMERRCDYPGDREKGKAPMWGQTWTQHQARKRVTKAILKKLHITRHSPVKIRNATTPSPRVQQQGGGVNTNRLMFSNQFLGKMKKKRNFANRQSLESDGEVGFDVASDSFGKRRQGKRSEKKSFRREYSLLWSDYGDDAPPPNVVRPTSRRTSFPDLGCSNLTSAKRPKSYEGLGPSSPAGYFNDGMIPEKRKRGRPFKHQIPGSLDVDVNVKPLREIFVSRRRKVTQAECENALNTAYKLASRLQDSTTFVVVMRVSFVYRNFVLGVPRRFASRYMPSSNREVTLVDEAWDAWYCTWNAAYNYMSGRGWRNFALEHCLEEDDALLMELLEETETRLKIKVHIFRVVNIPPRLTGWQSHVVPVNSVGGPTSGVPIQPMPHPPGKIRPRLKRPQPSPGRHRRHHHRGKRVRRDQGASYSDEDSISSDEYESDEL